MNQPIRQAHGKRGFAPLIIIVIILVIGAGVGGFLVFRKNIIPSSENGKASQQKESPEDMKNPIKPIPSSAQSIQPPSPKPQPELKPKSAPPASPEKTTTKQVNNKTPFFENGLGPLCSSDTCRQFCRDNPFTCEAYCVSRPQNKYCQQHFSFVYDINSSIGHPLMKLTEFRNYNYTFTNGKLDQEEPKIENIGITIDYYNKQTNKAGDFVFHTFTYPWNTEIYNQKIFYDFGETALKTNGSIEQAPEVTYIVPLSTKVLATTDGIITHIKQQQEGDMEFAITKPESPLWVFGYDHAINLIVKEGDSVVAGQVLGEVSGYSSKWLRGDGYGVVEISIANTTTAFIAHCPFMYLDESVKQEYLDKIKALYASWDCLLYTSPSPRD